MGRSRTSSICSMGVIPAMGSLLNWPIRYEREPSSRLPIYTGLPLMPATTPVYSGLAPWSRARIMSWPGPRAPRNTPRISTSIASGLVPVKTVQAVAVMPRRTSLSGKNPPLEGGGPAGAGRVCACNRPEQTSRSCARISRTISVARRIWVCFTRVSTSIRVQPWL